MHTNIFTFIYYICFLYFWSSSFLSTYTVSYHMVSVPFSLAFLIGYVCWQHIFSALMIWKYSYYVYIFVSHYAFCSNPTTSRIFHLLLFFVYRGNEIFSYDFLHTRPSPVSFSDSSESMYF